MITLESTGSAPTFLSSLRVSSAPTVGWSTEVSAPMCWAWPLSAIGWIWETTPTR